MQMHLYAELPLMPEALSPVVTAIWTRLNRSGAAIRHRAETALKSAGLPPLDWYDALWEIEQSGEAGIRPLTLQARLLLPQYGLSRLIDRIERAGLVARSDCAEDRRGQVLTLTPKGLETRAHMWPVYSGALTQAISGRLNRADAVQLAQLLGFLTPEHATAPDERTKSR